MLHYLGGLTLSLITRLPHILEDCKLAHEELLKIDPPEFYRNEIVKAPKGRLAKGDNLAYMHHLLINENFFGKLNLIYVDPPFFSKADYGNPIKLESEKTSKVVKMKQKAYEDTWENGLEEYLRMLTLRFFLMRDLLADDGCLWIHLDWHAVHYVKILLDEIFGADNFVNEVIWNYKSGGVSKRRFARKHDTLLFYGKTQNYYFKPQLEKSYNRDYKPYRFKGVQEYEDHLGWYTMVNMKDVWQLDMVGRTSAERTGYATQKPELLLERILESCSKEEDFCADFFGGSGTLAATAYKMNRNWISCDKGDLSMVNMQKRLLAVGAEFAVYEAEPKEENKKAVADISFKVHVEDILDHSGEKTLILELESYQIKDLKKLSITKDKIEEIRSILNNDPLSLLECWSIDTNYDGEIFRPEISFIRGKKGFVISYEKTATQFHQVAVKSMDVFGNIIFNSISVSK